VDKAQENVRRLGILKEERRLQVKSKNNYRKTLIIGPLLNA